MSEPIVFISHFRIKEGKLDAYRQLQRDVAGQLKEDKPRTLVFLIYMNQDGTQMTAIHVFADAESMDLHVQGSEERSRAAYEFLVPDGWEIYGTPSDHVVEMMRQAAASSGVTLIVQAEHAAGFLRLTSG
jgi:hypothetical protein